MALLVTLDACLLLLAFSLWLWLTTPPLTIAGDTWFTFCSWFGLGWAQASKIDIFRTQTERTHLLIKIPPFKVHPDGWISSGSSSGSSLYVLFGQTYPYRTYPKHFDLFKRMGMKFCFKSGWNQNAIPHCARRSLQQYTYMHRWWHDTNALYHEVQYTDLNQNKTEALLVSNPPVLVILCCRIGRDGEGEI